MSFNLRNRSLLTVQDYTQREFRYLLDLARDLKRAKYARTEQKHLDGKEIYLIFEKTSTRTRCAFESHGPDVLTCQVTLAVVCRWQVALPARRDKPRPHRPPRPAPWGRARPTG